MYLSSHKEKHCFLATEKKKGYTFPVLNFSRQLQYSSLSKRSLTPTTKPYPTPTTKHYPWNIWAPGFYIEDQVSAKDYKSHLPINMEVEKSVPNQKLLFHPTKRSTVFTLYSLSNYAFMASPCELHIISLCPPFLTFHKPIVLLRITL